MILISLLINLLTRQILTIKQVDIEVVREELKENGAKDTMEMEEIESGIRIVKRGSRGIMWTLMILITQ